LHNKAARKIILSNAHIARHWGFKAAQSGLPATSNPYRSPQARAAWEAGHRQVSADDNLTRCGQVSAGRA
jgi:ribosome modulation factor